VRQNSLICAAPVGTHRATADVHNGGSARGYQELSAPLASPTTVEQADGQAVFLCTATLGVNARYCRQADVWREGGTSGLEGSRFDAEQLQRTHQLDPLSCSGSIG
jgi:hypothetical protein